MGHHSPCQNLRPVLCAIKATSFTKNCKERGLKPYRFQSQSSSQQRRQRQDLEVEAKWDSTAQGRFVTRALRGAPRAFRKSTVGVKIPPKKA